MSTLTSAATRRRLRKFLERWPAIPRLLAWVGLFVASWPYIFLRGVADDTGMPRETFVLTIDRAIGFGETPSERLQDWFYTGGLSAFDWSLLWVHTAWFFVPAVITLYVVVFRWELFGQLATVRLGVLYVGLIGFFLFPTEPPWLATDVDVVRLLDIKAGEVLSVDTNPLAALPSLHVALPAAIAMWLWHRYHGVRGAHGLRSSLSWRALRRGRGRRADTRLCRRPRFALLVAADHAAPAAHAWVTHSPAAGCYDPISPLSSSLSARRTRTCAPAP